jgi:hypothetical protein
MQKEAVVAKFELLFQHFLELTEENHQTLEREAFPEHFLNTIEKRNA